MVCSLLVQVVLTSDINGLLIWVLWHISVVFLHLFVQKILLTSHADVI